MTMVTLVMIEAAAIQDYIFGSNNLLQNIGASELVARSTTTWLAAALNDLQLTHNTSWHAARGELEIAGGSAARAEVAVEVIYAGGGNALLLFGPGQDAYVAPFTRRLTRRGLEEARGLSLLVDSITFDWTSESLAQVLRALRTRMAVHKQSCLGSVPLPGLAVTADCAFTALPATGVDDEGRLIAVGVAHKLAASQAGQERLHKVLPEVREFGYDFVYDFDQLGEKGETSYMAVIHTDGNAMGTRLQQVAARHPGAADNEAYVKALRSFSQSVKDNAASALQSTVRLLLYSRDREDRFGGVVPVPVRYATYQDKPVRIEYLPFRPLVFGGDDVTFVCEGRLGLALAAHYLRCYSDPSRPLSDGAPAFARAGVAVTGAHYPFAHAYDLAVELCESAKQAIPQFVLAAQSSATTLDWHFAASGLLLGLNALRRREYVAANGASLLLRPVWIDPDPQPRPSQYWRSWTTFRQTALAFQRAAGWAGRRNKVKALRDALRGGPDAVRRFVDNYALASEDDPEQRPEFDPNGADDLTAVPTSSPARFHLPPIPTMPDMELQGWQGGECGYFDAVEALDFFVALDADKEQV